MQQPFENQRANQVQFFQPQPNLAPITPTFLKTSLENLDKMKSDEEDQSLSVYQTSAMNGIPRQLPFVMPLGGRGQDGFAGFVGQRDDESRQYLIKIDDPATCLLEGSAKFAQDLMLPGHENAVNFASTGLMTVTQPNKPDEIHTVSIQDRVAPQENHTIKPWDVVVYGSKRNPKRPISTEYFNQGNIKNNIAAMTEKAQWDLANAIFISTLVGDESLHVGQFMAEVDENNQVTAITRIDLGARERYSAARYNADDFQHQTSSLYKNSGQKGKDYISYLLNSPEVREKYLALWSRELDIQAIARNHARVFLEELSKLPETQQEIALNDIIKTVFKDSEIAMQERLDMNLDGKKENVAVLLKHITKKRMTNLQKSARQLLVDEVLSQKEATGKYFTPESQAMIQKLIIETDEGTIDNLASLNDYLANKAISSPIEHAQHYQKLAQTIIERQTLAQHADVSPEIKRGIQTQLDQMQQLEQRFKMIAALKDYQTHLQGKFKKVDAKKEQIRVALLMLQAPSQLDDKQFAYEPNQIFDKKFFQIVSKRRINPEKQTKSHGAQLLDNLEVMMEKYQLAQQEPLQEQVEEHRHSLRF